MLVDEGLEFVEGGGACRHHVGRLRRAVTRHRLRFVEDRAQASAQFLAPLGHDNAFAFYTQGTVDVGGLLCAFADQFGLKSRIGEASAVTVRIFSARRRLAAIASRSARKSKSAGSPSHPVLAASDAAIIDTDASACS